MKGINQTQFIGSITAKPELKYTPSELAILEFTVANRLTVETAIGTTEVPSYQRHKVFGKYAEALAEGLKAGQVVQVFGRLSYRAWEADDGSKRNAVDTVADSVHVLEGEFEFQTDKKDQQILIGGVNEATIGGNLTRDTQLRYTPNGNAITQLSVAVNEQTRNSDGETSERVGFFHIDAWRELGEAAAELRKGAPVIATGRVVNDSYEKDGARRYVTFVEAARLNAVSAGKQENSAAQEPPPEKAEGQAEADQPF